MLKITVIITIEIIILTEHIIALLMLLLNVLFPWIPLICATFIPCGIMYQTVKTHRENPVKTMGEKPIIDTSPTAWTIILDSEF